MHWILQNNIFKEEAYDRLVETLERFDIPYSIHKVVPFVGELLPEPELGQNRNVICFGSYSMRHQAKKNIWTPGVFDLEPVTFEVQREKWGMHMLNYLSKVYRFEDAVFPWFSVCSAHQLAGPDDNDCPRCKVGSYGEYAFIRPIEDSKVFAGKVFEKDEFFDWKRRVVVLEQDDGTTLKKDTLIQVAEVQEIYAEYRFWVVHGDIITASLYKRGDKVMYSSQVDERFFDYVRARISDWVPHAAFVIDVADTPRGIKIVEINTINSAGFYAADVQKLVLALEEGFSP